MKSKTAKIKAYLTANPDAKVKEVAAKFKVTPPYIYNLRKKMTLPGGLPLISVPEASKFAEDLRKKESKTVAVDATPVDTVLDTRAGQYGTFRDGAALMQEIKRALAAHAQKHGKTFADDQWEALEMIVHKMARIVNGNPDNHDSWVDIAGYAMLVADRLEGNAR